MHFAAAASHARGPEPERWITTQQVFTAATMGSARALGFDNIGRIAEGCVADIVFLDLDAPTLIPLNDPVSQAVIGEDGTSVTDVMVGGRFVVRDRRLLTVDLPSLAARATELRTAINERSAGSRARFDAVAPILQDFCPRLARTAWASNGGAGPARHHGPIRLNPLPKPPTAFVNRISAIRSRIRSAVVPQSARPSSVWPPLQCTR